MKKLLSLLLVLTMVFSMMMPTAFAADGDAANEPEVEEKVLDNEDDEESSIGGEGSGTDDDDEESSIGGEGSGTDNEESSIGGEGSGTDNEESSIGDTDPEESSIGDTDPEESTEDSEEPAPTEQPEEPTEESEEPTPAEEPTEETEEPAEDTEEPTAEETEEPATEEATEEEGNGGHSWPAGDIIDQWITIEDVEHHFVVSKQDPIGEGNEDEHVSVIIYPNPDATSEPKKLGVLRVHCELHPDDPNDVKEFAILSTPHNYTSRVIVKAPSCIKKTDGEVRYTCNKTFTTYFWDYGEERTVNVTWDYDQGYFIGHNPNCGDDKTEKIPWGHVWSDLYPELLKQNQQPYHDVDGKHPTCTEEGELVAYCLVCGIDRTKEDGSLDSFKVEPLHHRSLYDLDDDGYGDIDHLQVRLTVVPTCMKEGLAEIYCPLCEKYLTAEECDYFWEELGGDEGNRPTTTGTVYQKNAKGKWVAMTDDEKAAYEFSDFIDEYPLTLAKDPDNHRLSDWVEDVRIKDPTCVEEGEGIFHRFCVDCRTVFGAEHLAIPTVDHKWRITKAPTCTETGTKTCDVCGLEEELDIDPYAHPEEALKLIDHTPTTCYEDGENIYKCENCQMLVTEIYPKYDHPEEYRTKEFVVEGWCGDENNHSRKIQLCLKVMEEQVYDENGNPRFCVIHDNWFDWSNGVDLGKLGIYLADGTVVCGHEFLIEDLGAVPHKYNQWQKRNDYVPAEETENGILIPEYWTRYCTVCGHQEYRLYDEAHEDGWLPPEVEETDPEEPTAEPTEEPTAEPEDPTAEATEEPATEEPATEEPATEEPATEEPATEEPATEEPVTEEPATEEPAEPTAEPEEPTAEPEEPTAEPTEEPAEPTAEPTEEPAEPTAEPTEEPTEEPVKEGWTVDEDGKVRFYKDGEVDTTKTGVFEYDGEDFFGTKGVLDTDANGLNLFDNTWYFLAEGRVVKEFTGFAMYNDEWFVIENGILDDDFNGLYTYDGKQFVVAAGRLIRSVNGLWQDPATKEWVFCANGEVQNQFTGVAEYDGSFFVLKDGKLDDKDGYVEYDGATFVVSKGQLYPVPVEAPAEEATAEPAEEATAEPAEEATAEPTEEPAA